VLFGGWCPHCGVLVLGVSSVRFVLISYAVSVCIFCVMNSTESCLTIMLSQNASDSLIKSQNMSYNVYLKGI
jgi:hypothetical protein